MKLGVKTRYGVMAMIDIAQRGVNMALPMAEIAERQELPLLYLQKLVHKLARAKLLISVRGAYGGYKLARPATDISIYDIMVAVEDSAKMTRCPGDGSGCRPDGARCKTHHLWEELGSVIANYMSSVKLSSVVEETSKKPLGTYKHPTRVILFDGLA